jgi:hypothetical protein
LSENRCPLFGIMLRGRERMKVPAPPRLVAE